MKKLLAISLLMCGPGLLLNAYSATDIGSLVIDQGKLFAKIKGTSYPIKADEKVYKYTSSFSPERSKFIFTGEIKDNSYELSKVPQVVSGSKELTGILNKENGAIVLKTTEKTIPVSFIKPVNYMGNSFDEESINYYLGREVKVLGELTDKLTISAIMEKDLYSASPINGPMLHSSQVNDYKANKFEYIYRKMQTNELSQSLDSYRETITGENVEIKPGDHALVVTYAGRQGDDIEAAAGHLAVGIATVKEDLSLDMEIQNFYPNKNSKDIIPGHLHHLDYFGGISTGQTNYRPNYTFIAYGVDKERLEKMRSSIDFTYDFIRRNDDVFGIYLNCVTASWNGLKSIGIYGVHNRGAFRGLRRLGYHALNQTSRIAGLGTTSEARQMAALAGLSKGEYLPRSAFESILSDNANINASRIDFVFHQQLPSGRPQGGAALNEVKELKWMKATAEKGRRENRDINWNKEQLDQNIN